MEWRDPCEWEGELGSGWIYWDDWSSEEFWVSGDEWSSWDECKWCDNEWIWEECSWMEWRDACDWEAETDCGWIYWDDWSAEEFWVSCEDYDSWDECWECDNEWYYDDCWGQEYRQVCEWEDWGIPGESGWVYWDDLFEVEYWLTYESWMATCAY